MFRKSKWTMPLLLLLAFVSACSASKTKAAENFDPQATTTSTPTLDWLGRAIEMQKKKTANYLTPSRTPKPRPTRRPTATRTIPNTPTDVWAVPESTPVYVGTAIADRSAVIGPENIENLREVARWGRGDILDVAYAPDGQSFYVGSAYGVAVYLLHDLGNEPLWYPFDSPFRYEQLVVSLDNQYLLLRGRQHQKVYQLSNAGFIDAVAEIEWWDAQSQDLYQDLGVKSSDGSLEFRGGINWDAEDMNLEISWAEVLDTESGEKLFDLQDESQYITVYESTDPEACDVHFVSMCGNAYMPSVSAPYQAAFSPDNSTFAVVYRAPNLFNSNHFSTMRMYATEDGHLIETFGSLSSPVEGFAYDPNGASLLIAYIDGTIQIWNIESRTIQYSARHFHSALSYLAFSGDGKFLLIQRPTVLEVRSMRDGNLRSVYAAHTSMVSPRGDWVAVGSNSGEVRILDIQSGETIQRFDAHDDRVYALAFSPDGRYLASSGEDCNIRMWSIESGELEHPFEQTIVDAYGEPNWVSRIFIYAMEFVPNSNQVIGFGSYGTVVNWNVNSGATRYVVESEPLEYYQGMMTLDPHFPEFFDIDPEGGRFFINNLEYNMEDGEIIGEYQRPEGLPENCGYPGPSSANGSLLFTRGYDFLEGQICVLNADNLELITRIEVFPPEASNHAYIDWLYVSPNGEYLVVSTYSGVVIVYQIVQ
jgi:WD40 repeat protein